MCPPINIASGLPLTVAGSFLVPWGTTKGSCLQTLAQEASKWPGGVGSASILGELPAVFSSALGTANCAPYEIESTDPTPVRSSLYRCAPPKLAIFRTMVNELLEQGVVRPSKSPYASPAFLVPKSAGGFRMVKVK